MVVRRLFVVILLLFMSVGCDHCEEEGGSSGTGSDADLPDAGPDTGLTDGGVDSGELCGTTACSGDDICFLDQCFPSCATSADCAAPDLCFDGRCAADACEGVACSTGLDCVSGSCRTPCSSSSDCAAGEACFDDGYCADDPCNGVSCPHGAVCYQGSCYDSCVSDGDCTPPNLCFDSRCAIDACTGVSCPLGEVCVGGTCAPACGSTSSCQSDADCTNADETCQNINPTTGNGYCLACESGTCFGSVCDADADCGTGESCYTNGTSTAGACVVSGCDPAVTSGCAGGDLACQSDPCDGVQCSSSQVCYEGSCYDSCVSDGDCTPPNLCYDNVCAQDLCADVKCPLGQVCYEGSCYDPCVSDGDCTPPNLCYDGRCALDPCDNVVCPLGDVCFEGSCYDPCISDGDCTPPNLCFNELCSDDPCVGLECGVDQICFEGSCYGTCISDGDCTPPNLCYDGTCSTDPCLAYECPAGQTCACGSVDPGIPAAGSITAMGETSVFRFTANEGELITLRTESADFSGNMDLIGPVGPLETVAFTTTDDAWLPYRVPVTGTYTVEIAATTGTGNFDITYINYGLESAMQPTLFEGQVTSGMPTDFYFFGRPDEIFVADLVVDAASTSTTATGEFELLQPDETWSTSLNPVGSEPLTEIGYVTSPAVIAAAGTAETIYRLRVTPGSVSGAGGGAIDVRMDKMAPQTAVGTIRVDSTGNCAGYEASIARLASLALFAGGTIEICDGTHVEYGTLYLGPGAASEIRGTSSAAVLQFGANRDIPAPRAAPAFVIDSATDATIQQLAIQSLDPSGMIPAERAMFDIGTNPSTDTLIQDVSVQMADLGTFVFQGFGRQDGLRLINFTASGQVNLGLLSGDDIEMRGVSIAAASGDVYETISVVGQRTTIADSVIGNAPNTYPAGISLGGDGSILRKNTIYSNFTISFSSMSARVAGAVVEENEVIRGPVASGSTFQIIGVDNLRFVANYVVETTSNTGATMLMQDTSGEILNNRFDVAGRDIIALTQENSSSVSYDLDIMNNTFVLAGGSGKIIDLEFVPFNMLVPPVDVVNNIFVNEGAVPTSTQSAFCANRQVATGNYNLYDNFAAIPCAASGTALSLGADSFTAAAGLAADLTLTAGSPAIDAGTDIDTPTADYAGEARPRGTAYDIGADEF